jgi:hypothetical protein
MLGRPKFILPHLFWDGVASNGRKKKIERKTFYH